MRAGLITRVWALSLLLQWPAIAAATGGASGIVRLLEGGDRSGQALADPKVETWQISQAIGYVGERGDVSVVLAGQEVDFDGFGAAADARQWVWSKLHGSKARFVEVGVRTNPAHSSAHAYGDGMTLTPASSGTVYAARVEDGRLRGRLVTMGGLRGSLFTDVQLDVPLWQAPPFQPLPSDGGEPGAALLALEAATQAADAHAIRALLGPVLLGEFPDDKDFAAEAPKLRDQFGKGHVVQKGVVHGDTAILLSKATARGREVNIRTLWRRIDGRWRFDSISFNTTELMETSVPPKPFIEVEAEPKDLADQPQVKLDGQAFTLRHARAIALPAGAHLVVFSDRPLPARLPAPAEAARWSAWSTDKQARLMMLQLPAGGPEWDLDEVSYGPAGAPPETDLVRGTLTRIGTHLSGTISTLRFPQAGGVETGETVVLDLAVEQ